MDLDAFLDGIDLTPVKAWFEIETCERRDDEIAVLERLFQAGWLHGYAKGMLDSAKQDGE